MPSGAYTVRVQKDATIRNASVIVPRGAAADYDVEM
jgi:hypothetical protein